MDLRSLPAVHRLADGLALPRGLAVTVARAAVDQARAVIESGGEADAASIAAEVATRLRQCLRTGTYCSYTSDPLAPIDWVL